MPDACISRALPSSRVGLADPSLDALTGDRLEARHLGLASCRAPRRRARSPAARGCSLPCLERGGKAKHLVIGEAVGRLDAGQRGLALGQGSGLVDDEVSTEASRSSAAALRTSTPACAPRPVATMMEIGVASPSAQGQAMMSTLTAATSA